MHFIHTLFINSLYNRKIIDYHFWRESTLKKILMAAMSSIVTFSFFLAPISVEAKTLQQLQTERADLKKKTEEAKKNLEEARQKKQSVEEEVAVLDQTLNAANEQLEKVESDLDEVQKRLEESKKMLAEATENKEKQLTVFGQRVKYIHENGNTGYLDVILESEGISDLLMRMQHVEEIIDYDNNLLTNLKETENVIREKKEEVQQEEAETAQLVEEQKATLASLETLKAEKIKTVQAYAQDEAKYNQLVQSNEAASKEVEKLISAATANNDTVVYTGGKLNWPVPARAASSSSLSSGFVNRKRPIGSGWEKHTGYDIPAPYGSNIVAAEGGTVITAGWVNGYGNTVMINHGGGVVTLYGHNSSLTVSKGQTVSRGQVIAKCGSTGNSTGNHCHFEVRVNGSAVSPAPYLGVANISR